MKSDELLAEVEIWCIRAIENSKTPLSGYLFSYLLSSVHWSIIIQHDKPLSIFWKQGLHFAYSFWEERLEILALDGMRENHKGNQLLVSGGSNNMQGCPSLLVEQVIFQTLWQPAVESHVLITCIVFINVAYWDLTPP